MSARTWKIMLGVYMACLLALLLGFILPRLGSDIRGFTYGLAVILGFLALSLARYFFKK